MPNTPYYNMRYEPNDPENNLKSIISYYINSKFDNVEKKQICLNGMNGWSSVTENVTFKLAASEDDADLRFYTFGSEYDRDLIAMTQIIKKDEHTIDHSVVNLNVSNHNLNSYDTAKLSAVACNAVGHALSLKNHIEPYNSVMYKDMFLDHNFALAEYPQDCDKNSVIDVYSKPPGEAHKGTTHKKKYEEFKLYKDKNARENHKQDVKFLNPLDVSDYADLVFVGKVKEKKNIIKQDEDYWMTFKARVDHKVKGKLADPYEVEIHQYGSDEGGSIPALHNLRYLQAGDSIVFMGNYKENGILSAVNEGDGLFVKHPGLDRYSSSLEGSLLSNVQFSLDQLLGCNRGCKC
ncbi:hypothetical protein VQL36_16480 [Chengkuizengella sp. SCS-71B]|uniref:hypothetical protein n=1 Tax=Chengkuizengella sp. SCS-71B TaxID=3115290 RepID=UPI0032C2168E